jgi:hypothetical protein
VSIPKNEVVVLQETVNVISGFYYNTK